MIDYLVHQWWFWLIVIGALGSIGECEERTRDLTERIERLENDPR